MLLFPIESNGNCMKDWVSNNENVLQKLCALEFATDVLWTETCRIWISVNTLRKIIEYKLNSCKNSIDFDVQ